MNKAAKKLGKLGGQATLKKHGKKHFSELAKKRWRNKNSEYGEPGEKKES